MSHDLKIMGVILARMGSRRFPGKEMALFGGMPLLQFIINRAKDIKGISLALATTLKKENDVLVEIAKQNAIGIYRGSENDAAINLLRCAKKYNADYVIRINGDSPFLDRGLIENGMRYVIDDFDLITNIPSRTYPYGISLEIIKVKALEDCYPEMDDYDREHVTAYFYRHPEKFRILELIGKSQDKGRYTIDYPEDIERLNEYLLRTPIGV